MQASLPGYPGKVIESGYTDVEGVATSSYVLRYLPITGNYDPTRYYPKVTNGGDLYPISGATYIGTFMIYWQDFTNNRIVCMHHFPSGSTGQSYRLFWEIWERPAGVRLYQSLHSVLANPGNAAPIERTITLDSEIRSVSKHALQHPFRGRYMSNSAMNGYNSWGNGLRIISTTQAVWWSTYAQGGADIYFNIPIVILH